MRYILSLLFLVILLGCQTTPSLPPGVIKADVIVPISRKVNLPIKPEMVFQDSLKTEPFDILVKKMLSEIETRKGYELLLETSVNACNKDWEESQKR